MSRRKPKGRAVDGILLLNKPTGMTSNAALQTVKRLFGAAKAGHTGALDPLATGMLPLCFGEATKFSQFLLDADKRYLTTAKLGVRTTTSDADGEVVAEAPVGAEVTAARIEQLLAERFSGEIEQVPSMYSALKFNGQPLYKLARKGIEVEVKPRRVMIYDIRMTAFRGDEVDLDVRCSKGTYIRSIVEDLGLLLGCGAHVQRLHRLDSGPYKASMMIGMEQLEQIVAEQGGDADRNSIQQRLDQLLLPAWTALGDAPSVELAPELAARILNGQRLQLPELSPQPLVRLFEAGSQRFLGVAEVSPERRLLPRRLLNTAAQPDG